MSLHAEGCTCVPTWPPLTRPEVATLQLISKGCSYEECADILNVAVDTIKGRMKRTYKKLGASNAPHAVAIAIGMRLIFVENPLVGGGAAMGPARETK